MSDNTCHHTVAHAMIRRAADAALIFRCRLMRHFRRRRCDDCLLFDTLLFAAFRHFLMPLMLFALFRALLYAADCCRCRTYCRHLLFFAILRFHAALPRFSLMSLPC